MVIGVCGSKYNGKDTIADFFIKHATVSLRKYSLAEPIKNAAREIFGFTYEQVTDYELKESPDEYWGCKPRNVLQYIGTEIGQYVFPNLIDGLGWIGRGLWVYKFIKDIYIPGSYYIIPDIRFEHEVELLKKHVDSFILVRIDRPDFEANDRHSSEQSFYNLVPDYIVENSGSLEDLEVKAKIILKGISLYDS